MQVKAIAIYSNSMAYINISTSINILLDDESQNYKNNILNGAIRWQI